MEIKLHLTLLSLLVSLSDVILNVEFNRERANRGEGGRWMDGRMDGEREERD